jgi:hypothetical protein
MNITSRSQTCFKKQPLSSEKLLREDKAKIAQGRTFKVNRIIENKNGHTQICFGGLGEWWVEDTHWNGLTPETPILPYTQKDDLIYLPDIPYTGLGYSDQPEIKNTLSCCVFSWLSYLAPSKTMYLSDYISLVAKNDQGFIRHANKISLRELGLSITFTSSADAEDIKKELKNGRPVITNIAYIGPSTLPSGFGYYVLITGYTNTAWLVQDPGGQLDLINGGWLDTGSQSGKDVLYCFEHFNPRLFYNGGATGHCFMRLRKTEE